MTDGVQFNGSVVTCVQSSPLAVPFDIVLCACSPPAVERLSGGLFHEVITTNTIPVREQNYFPQLTVLSVANLLGETIWRVHEEGSVSSMLIFSISFGIMVSVSNFCEEFV